MVPQWVVPSGYCSARHASTSALTSGSYEQVTPSTVDVQVVGPPFDDVQTSWPLPDWQEPPDELSQLNPTSVSIPFKLLMFVVMDGWAVLVHGLVLAYR